MAPGAAHITSAPTNAVRIAAAIETLLPVTDAPAGGARGSRSCAACTAGAQEPGRAYTTALKNLSRTTTADRANRDLLIQFAPRRKRSPNLTDHMRVMATGAEPSLRRDLLAQIASCTSSASAAKATPRRCTPRSCRSSRYTPARSSR